MRELHHIGIPTTEQKPNEIHLADAKLYITKVTESPNRIEWLRFEEGSPMPDLLKTSPHISYVVPDLKAAMEGQEVLIEPFTGGDGQQVGFIVEEGIPIEFMQLDS